MVRDLSLVRLVVSVVVHLARPETVIEFLPRDNFLWSLRQEQQVAEIGGAQRDGNAPVKEELLPFVHEDDRWIGEQFPEVFGVGKAGA